MKRQYTIILTVLFMIFYNVASGLQFADCGSYKGELTNMVVSGCNTTSDACLLQLGTKVPITIGFTVSEEVTAVTAYAYGTNPSFFIYLLNPTDGCVNGDLKCPLPNGTNYEYKGVLKVPKDHPTASVLVKWELLDQNEEIIVCVQFPAKFV